MSGDEVQCGRTSLQLSYPDETYISPFAAAVRG
jgi:hypothetical protein